MKQVLATFINHSRVHFLEPTSTGVIWGIMVVTRVGFEPTIPMLWDRHLIHKVIAPLTTSFMNVELQYTTCFFHVCLSRHCRVICSSCAYKIIFWLMLLDYYISTIYLDKNMASCYSKHGKQSSHNFQNCEPIISLNCWSWLSSLCKQLGTRPDAVWSGSKLFATRPICLPNFK